MQSCPPPLATLARMEMRPLAYTHTAAAVVNCHSASPLPPCPAPPAPLHYITPVLSAGRPVDSHPDIKQQRGERFVFYAALNGVKGSVMCACPSWTVIGDSPPPYPAGCAAYYASD